MCFSNRLIGECGEFFPSIDTVRVNVGEFINRILLFDKYILISIRFKELPDLLTFFGYEGLKTLLESGFFKIYSQASGIAQVGQSQVYMPSGRKVLPLGSFSFRHVKQNRENREEYLELNFRDAKTVWPLNIKKSNKLKESLFNSLIEIPEDFGLDALRQLETDMVNDLISIKNAVCFLLEKENKIQIASDEYNLNINQIDQHDFRVDTNLGKLINKDLRFIHKIVEQALMGIARRNKRIEYMKVYNAISGFRENELYTFEEKLNVLAQRSNPNKKIEDFKRVLEIVDFPFMDTLPENKKIDIEKLIKVRESKELVEFKVWLNKIHKLSDEEIKDIVNNVKTRIGNFIEKPVTKVIRYLTSTALGQVMGPIPGLLDGFIIKKIFPKSGPILFISSSYPSIFEKRRKT